MACRWSRIEFESGTGRGATCTDCNNSGRTGSAGGGGSPRDRREGVASNLQSHSLWSSATSPRPAESLGRTPSRQWRGIGSQSPCTAGNLAPPHMHRHIQTMTFKKGAECQCHKNKFRGRQWHVACPRLFLRPCFLAVAKGRGRGLEQAGRQGTLLLFVPFCSGGVQYFC